MKKTMWIIGLTLAVVFLGIAVGTVLAGGARQATFVKFTRQLA